MTFPTPKKKPLPTKRHVEAEVKTYINSADTPDDEPGAGLDPEEKLAYDFQLKINRWERECLQWIAKRQRRSMRFVMRDILRMCLREEVEHWKAKKPSFFVEWQDKHGLSPK